MKPVISIIIPCFNSGKYLPEALTSIDTVSNPEMIEIIIVDDGSNDRDTLSFLDNLNKNRYKIIHQENRGPAAARNTGVQSATSDYLLFLDSDNKIRPDYIDRGIEIMNRQADVGVVYGNAAFFGDTTESRFTSKPFDIFSLLLGNYIDVCSVVRKKAFQEIDGFDESRILFGHEDWELWIRMFTQGWKFHYIDRTFFDYRVRKNSLLMQKSESKNLKEVLRFVYKKHLDLFIDNHEMLYHQYKFYNYDKSNPLRTFVKSLYRKYIHKEKNTTG